MQDLFQNQKIIALKKFMIQILGQKYPIYDELVQRSTFNLVTDNDLTSFGKMISDIYETGYMKAVADYKDQLAKLGINVKISQKN